MATASKNRVGSQFATALLAAGLSAGAATAAQTAITSGSDAPGVVFAVDYGMVCDGVADDTTALQDAINAAISANEGGEVILPPGTCNLSDTIEIYSVRGLRLRGTGGLTTLYWERTAPNNVPMLDLLDARDCIIEDLRIEASSADAVTIELDRAIRIGNDSTSTAVVPTTNTIRDVTISGTNGAIREGIAITDDGLPGTLVNTNNEHHAIERVRVFSTAEVGIRIQGSNAKYNRILHTSIGGDRGDYGVYNQGGSFVWLNGAITRRDISDFYINGQGGTINIIGHDSENSLRLLETAGPSGAEGPVHMSGVRFTDSDLNADGCWVVFRTRGPFTLRDSLLGRQGSIKPAGLCFTPGGVAPLLVAAEVTNNMFSTSLQNPFLDTALCTGTPGLCRPAAASNNLILRVSGTARRPFP